MNHSNPADHGSPVKPQSGVGFWLRCLAVGYLGLLTAFLVLPDAWQFMGRGGKEIEAQVDATIAEVVQHSAVYVLLAILLLSAFGGSRSWTTIGAFCLVHGIVTEWIQWFVPNRYFGWPDLLANIAGAGLGVVLFGWISGTQRTRRVTAAGLVLAATLGGCGDTTAVETPRADDTREPQAQLRQATPWIGQGMWLKIDTHVHTKFSDGAHDIPDVLSRAVEFGCDAVAITDHIDRLDAAEIPDYLEAIQLARRQFPDLIVIVGLEWNVPPGGGDEHATVLFPDELATASILTEFCESFDDFGREVHDAAVATQGLKWLGEQRDGRALTPIVSLNHPSRKWERVGQVGEYYRLLADGASVLIGFSGAPGHQAGKNIGVYEDSIQTVDRWDPVVSTDGVWDSLLKSGHRVFGGLAPSDFHRHGGEEWGDYWPGEFSETWVYAPERTVEGVIQALHRGTYFANHGGIVRDITLTLRTDGLERPAHPGETVMLPGDQMVEISLEGEISAVDLAGHPSRIDDVEILVITTNGVVSHEFPVEDAETLSIQHETRLGREARAVRARGRRRMKEGPDLMFYTNPIFVEAEAKD